MSVLGAVHASLGEMDEAGSGVGVMVGRSTPEVRVRNDDLGRLQRIPTAMAAAARRTLQDDLLSVLIDNPDADPHDYEPTPADERADAAEEAAQYATNATAASRSRRGSPSTFRPTRRPGTTR